MLEAEAGIEASLGPILTFMSPPPATTPSLGEIRRTVDVDGCERTDRPFPCPLANLPGAKKELPVTRVNYVHIYCTVCDDLCALFLVSATEKVGLKPGV